MTEPVIAKKSPYAVELEAGQTVYWCACGQSGTQPFCDGSHQGTEHTPVPFTAERSGAHYLCGCKQTREQPMCDGTHTEL